MWISKKEFCQLREDSLDLKLRVIAMENAHINMTTPEIKIAEQSNQKDVKIIGYNYCFSHSKSNYIPAVANTKEITNVTFEEIARLYLDKTPIKREKTIVVEYGNK